MTALTTLNGLGVSGGTTVGVVALVALPQPLPDELASTDLTADLTRVADALETVASRLDATAATLTDDAADMIAAAAAIARDPGLVDAVEKNLKTLGAAHALHEAVNGYALQFAELGGYFAERVTDLLDIGARTEAIVLGRPMPGVPELTTRTEKQRARQRISERTGPGQTSDGHPVMLLADIGNVADAELAGAAEVEGVGLFRTEFLHLSATTAPTVAEQSDEYIRVLTPFGNRPVTVRTLDAGADKPLAFADLGPEPNPALGRRGVRLMKEREDLLDDQLAALAMAAAYTGALAADRMVGELSDLLDPWQPAVLDMVAAACDGGRAVGKPVGVCGESAGDPLMALVLTGLGVTSLSMSVPRVPMVRWALSQHTAEECVRLAETARAAVSAEAAHEAVRAASSPELTLLL